MAEQNRAEDHSITSDVNIRKVLGTGAVVLGTVALVVAGVFALRGLFPVQSAHAPQWPTTPAAIEPLAHLQSNPVAERQAFQVEKRALLNSYDWVDRDAGIVRIPMDRAIELLVATPAPEQVAPFASEASGSETSTATENLTMTEPASKAAVPESTSSSAGSETITVKPGEYLYSIAKRIYGDASKWRLIYDANRNQLANPDAVRVGMKLVVPATN